MQTVKAITTVAHDTTANWNKYRDFIPKSGEIIVYTDRAVKQEDGKQIKIPGVKIGDGLAYLIDLPFLGGISAESEDYTAIMEELTSHENNMAIHVSAEDRTRWNAGLTCSVNAEELILNWS